MEQTSLNSSGKLDRFKTKPYKHQFECLMKFGRKQAFALLAEMGTGKTWIVINNMADLWASKECDAVLVFAPNGVHTNWTRLELPKHMPDWSRYRAAAWSATQNKAESASIENLYNQADGELRIFTMNWEALQTKRGFEAAQRFANCSRRLMIVCDESDSFKNPSTERAKALMKLKKFSHWRRIMTGTPINNSPFDAFSQFTFLDETILGTTSFFAFKAEYAEMLSQEHGLMQHLIEKKTKMNHGDRLLVRQGVNEIYKLIVANGREELSEIATNLIQADSATDMNAIIRCNEVLKTMFSKEPSPKKTLCLQWMARVEEAIMKQRRQVSAASNPRRLPQIVDKDKAGKPKYRNLEKLSRLIAPHSFRVLKSECLDLPEKIYKTLTFSMTKQQIEVYKKAEEECRIIFEGEETPFNKLVAVTKLAQITSGYYIHPLADEPVRIEGENPKLELLAERVQKIVEAGAKVIVWARYRIEIEDICQKLAESGISFVEYHGGTRKSDRIEAIESFQNGDSQVFVGNQQAGGTGITLTAAEFVIYFSNNFSLRDRLQSEDRAHRIGQTKNVTYINIAAKGTIDEVVVKALSNKKDVADTIIDVGLKLFS